MDWMFIVAVILLLAGIGCLGVFFVNRPKPDEDGRIRMSRDDAAALGFFKVAGGGGLLAGIVLMLLASVSIIQTGQAGVVRVMGVVQQEALGEGFNTVAPWATVTRQETRGFQIDQTGDRALEVLTANGTRFTMDIGVPVKLNPESVALVESRINNGDWQGEVTAIQRGIIRTNVASYPTFAEFQIRRNEIAEDGVSYGEELASQIEDRVNGLFCDTYGICGIEVVDVGEVLIRRVNAPSAITAEAAALEAAQLAQQTERALNEVELIRAQRREAEGDGYGNLFSFLPDDAELSADDAANFLRAAADKTRADADAYMQRTLAESISESMAAGRPIPSLIVSAGGQTPTPVFNPHGSLTGQ